MINALDPIDKWHLERWSKFTSSENFKLLIKPTSSDKFWSVGALTYIEQKAIEAVTRLEERPELDEVDSLLHGKVYEQPAFQEYVRVTKNYSITYMGSENPIFIYDESLPEESGGTPDAANITKDHKIDMGVELKCPKKSSYHFKRLNWKGQWDIKENYALVYTQIQHLMMITGATEWHFASFDDRQLYTSKKIKIIPVYPDQKFQDNLEIRI